MVSLKISDADKAAIKTTVNIFILLILFFIGNRGFELDLTAKDLEYWAPVLAIVVGLFYRLSLVVAQKWPPVGYVLFGIKEPPIFIPEPKEEISGS